jgi:hypothetical protein
MNPPIKTFAPVPTTARVEILASIGGPGETLGVAVGVGVGEAEPFTM